ncbi:MAG: hypothetical protein ABW082_00965 [Sedimenticola sp.]
MLAATFAFFLLTFFLVARFLTVAVADAAALGGLPLRTAVFLRAEFSDAEEDRETALFLVTFFFATIN